MESSSFVIGWQFHTTAALNNRVVAECWFWSCSYQGTLKSPLVLQNDSPDEGDSGADSDRSDSESVTQHKLSHIDPLANGPCYGVDLYAQALQTLLS